MPRKALSWHSLRREPDARPGTNNGTLSYGRLGLTGTYSAIDSIPIWVYDVTSDFALTGTTAQSLGKRDFYARNFNQPVYNIAGQTHNEFDYGHIAEFIRDAQEACVFGATRTIMQMLINGHRGADEVILQPGTRNERRAPIIRNQRGRRGPLGVQGYVNTIRRAHKQFVNAPEYQFQFIIQRSLQGPFKDERTPVHVLPTNWNAFIRQGSTGFITDPDEILLNAPKGGKPIPVDESYNPQGSLVPRNPDGTPG